MPTLKLRFPGGRYHATPWGHHVNEGLIEWPPSPWRLLRALVACGFSSQGWTEIPLHAQQLIGKLAGVLPSYRLPEASAAHSRHYMPYIEGKKQNTTLVFDTWANVGEGELLIRWPCELSADETALLSQLATSLGYLGRSESWVEAELIADNPSIEFNAEPHREGEHPGREFEQLSLMAAIPAEEYRRWQEDQVKVALDSFPLPEGKKKPAPKLLKARDQAVAPYPPDLLSCLTKDTAWWKQHGWSQPPGSQRVLYWRRSDSLQVGAPMQPRRPASPPVECMLLSLTTPSGNRSALPPVTRTLPQAELFHRAIICRAANGERIDCPSLTGKDDRGNPLHDHHDHAHTIALDLDGDQHIDHVLIYARGMLCDVAQRGIRNLRRTWTKGGVGDIQVAVVGHGGLDTLRRLPPPLHRPVEDLLGPPAGARIWESATPFVPPRFLKPRGMNTLAGQVNAELAARRLPQATSVLVDDLLTRDLRHHVRRRNHGGVPPPVDFGYGLRLTFSEPMHGPLMLGYASHYGLGRFRPRNG